MTISVVICTYNGSAYIKEQLSSIIDQTLTPSEIVVCDDCSDDNTVAIVKEVLSSTNIPHRVEVNSRTIGVTKNFERAIGLSRGSIILLSDQDDVWINRKIELIVNVFRKHPCCVLVFSDALLVDHNLKPLGFFLWESFNYSNQLLAYESIFQIMLNRCVVTGATMAISRKLYDVSVPFPENWLHDGWLSINSQLIGDSIGLDVALILYRQHSANLIGASRKNIVLKVKLYFSNFKIINKLRKERYSKYFEFYQRNHTFLVKSQRRYLVECLLFWRDMTLLEKLKRRNALQVILKNLINKRYFRYYTGLRGAFRDILQLYVNLRE